MRDFEIAVGVIAALFTVGIVVGVLVIAALPGPRRRRHAADDTGPRWPGGTSA